MFQQNQFAIPDLSNSPMVLSSQIDTILNQPMTRDQIRKYIPYIYDVILNRIYETDFSLIARLNNNPEFFLELLDYMYSLLLQNEIHARSTYGVKMNKIMYDFKSSVKKNDQNKQCESELFRVINHYNAPVIAKLVVTGLPAELLHYIVIIGSSSLKANVNIERLNYITLALPINYVNKPLSSQQMIDIYTGMFRHMAELLKTTMFDVYKIEKLEEMSEISVETYGAQGLALIDILNHMDYASIREVLRQYAVEYAYRTDAKEIRFSMNSIAQYDYAKIYQAMDELKLQGYIVP